MNQDPVWQHQSASRPVEKVEWYQCDQLGTPIELSNDVGYIVWSSNHKAWGQTITGFSDSPNGEMRDSPLRFQGQYFDIETGLHYNRHRYYNPSTGRYITKDPIGFLGDINVYTYAPNPTEWIDPLGLARNCQLGRYTDLTGQGHEGDSLDAHEFIRHQALRQMGITSSATRNPNNPAIAIPRSMHTAAHRNEAVLADRHLNLGINQFDFNRSGTPSKRQMDVWQGALRQAGVPASQARKLRAQANQFINCDCSCS
ncbi:hypothetical protein IAE37_002532 [Pseudomonas sp. S31]|nr:hypothetical protein [Pseudomonas sp. S31]